jgi:hypothetical protein
MRHAIVQDWRGFGRFWGLTEFCLCEGCVWWEGGIPQGLKAQFLADSGVKAKALGYLEARRHTPRA